VVPDGIGTWIRRQRVKSADKVALVFRGEEMRYPELSDRIDRLASALRDRGIAAGDRVAYLGNNHPAFIEALFATTLLGAIFVPLNTRLSGPELAFQLGDCGAALLISGCSLEDRAAAGTAGLRIHRIVVTDPELDEPLPAETEPYERVVELAAPLGPTPRVTLDDPALILYTSGTTGRPKGAVLTHGNVTWNCFNALVDYGFRGDERSLLISPMFHVAALDMGAAPTLLVGGTLLIQERFVPGEALQAIQDLKATAISGVPTTYQLMMEDPKWDEVDISSLRTMTCGGSPVPLKVFEAYAARGLAFTGGYGMTESAPGITALPPQYAVSRAGSSGLAHFFTEYRLRDTETGEIVTEPGARGEIESRGPNIFKEYWNRPEATADALVDDWLRTGDIGYSDEDGFIYIADRVKDMIISGGENIYSAEVEIAIAAIDGVTGVAVIGVPDEKWGETPHAVVTLAPGKTLDAETMVGLLRQQLAGYKIPRTLEIVEELPRTASGKIQKAVLRAKHEA